MIEFAGFALWTYGRVKFISGRFSPLAPDIPPDYSSGAEVWTA